MISRRNSTEPIRIVQVVPTFKPCLVGVMNRPPLVIVLSKSFVLGCYSASRNPPGEEIGVGKGRRNPEKKLLTNQIQQNT